jgi:6-pyruvoyltetrahydropterin/6-carboxytetrahydropterin synthase
MEPTFVYGGYHTATRYHDISCGHRVVGHEGKCRFLHGHNYRVHFTCRARNLDSVGRVVDFGVIKEALCMWLEVHWDHKMLLWDQDQMCAAFEVEDVDYVPVPFNPTAENMAEYLVRNVAPAQLGDLDVECFRVTIEETSKCSATYEIQK